MSYDQNNIFAKILSGDIPSQSVYEDEDVYAFYDVNPAAPIHVLIIPKTYHSSFDDFVQNADPTLVSRFFCAVQKVARLLNVTESGYRLITNHGHDAHQTVPHFHMHLLGGRPLGGLLKGDDSLR